MRITIYRRLINAIGLDEIDALCDEMSDRFGAVPSEVKYLAGLTAAKNFGGRYGIREVNVKKGTVTVKYSGVEIPERVRKYLKSLGRNIKFTTEG